MSKLLDTLYSQYFEQLIRVKNNPTYVEKNILKSYYDNIINLYLSAITKLRECVDNELEINKNSYYGWSLEYYETQHKEQMNVLTKLIKQVNEVGLYNFLDYNFVLNEEEQEQLNMMEIKFSHNIPKSELKDELTKRQPEMNRAHLSRTYKDAIKQST